MVTCKGREQLLDIGRRGASLETKSEESQSRNPSLHLLLNLGSYCFRKVERECLL